ncbi:sensor histidine kinase [Tenacibaculum sp. FZY0031]|uniref:tetratricopeptide repeat-containing sensor histidine kinase n=1 Tax=Tenacibaculum sp. FZY0031 TaxID=3116648 RepID=UPI002EA4B7C2|nr:sensor histidine kinase [Tenacibaculum sp. FZY0031]
MNFINTYILIGFILIISINPFLSNPIFSQEKEKRSAYSFFNEGLNYSYQNKADLAYMSFIKALKIYEARQLKDSVAECNLKLFYIIDSQKNNSENPLPYLIKYKNYAEESNDTIRQIISNAYLASYYFLKDFKKSEKFYKKGLKQSLLINNELFQANFYTNLGALYNEYDTILDINNHKKAINIYHKLNMDGKLFSSYLNIAEHYRLKKSYKKAIEYLKKAETVKIEHYNKKLLKKLYERLALNYQSNKEYKLANNYFIKFDSIKELLNNSKQNTEISRIKEQYDNEKLKAENLISESKRKQNRNLFIAALSLLCFGGIIGLLTLKNSHKKRLLAEQQQELEQQKNLTLLKEQEINTINAMIDGQEKERIRIAEDLHDNIGSVLATLKLHFENLQLNREKKHFNQEELYEKTEKLIDETYLKVRNIAHAKNAGVLANKGLLTAIKLMAEKISDANKITIQVLDFGLNKRLDNNIEITVFRIIQELITNIIKHAEATEATVNIALYDQNLNIIVEDNGKGFVPSNNAGEKDGMGITSIQTRVNHLKGTFTIDSTPNKGTSIIINIPTL